jgi:predicted amidohydrolase
MKTVRIAAAQTVEFREDMEAALNCVADFAARAENEGASLLCFPEGFLQGYLTDEGRHDETLWTSRHAHSRRC